MPGPKCDHPTRKLKTNLGKILDGLNNLKDMNVGWPAGFENLKIRLTQSSLTGDGTELGNISRLGNGIY